MKRGCLNLKTASFHLCSLISLSSGKKLHPFKIQDRIISFFMLIFLKPRAQYKIC